MKTINPNCNPTADVRRRSLALLLAISVVPMLTPAADVHMTSNDSYGTSSLTSAGKWSDGQAPVSTNDYFSSDFYIRTPPSSGSRSAETFTFAGHSLTLQQPAPGNARSVIFKGNSGDVIVVDNLTNAYGGILENGGSGNSAVTYTGNKFTIAADSVVDANQGPLTVGYPLVGGDGVILTNAGGNGTGIIYSNDNSGFTGKFYISSSANYGNGSGNTTVTLATKNAAPGNPATFTPDQILLTVGCTLQDNAGIMFNNANGGITLAGNASIYAATTTVIGEPITDNGSNYVLTATGPGTLVLSNANNSYSGGTTVAAGTLTLGVANSLPSSGPLTVNGTLDLNTHNATVGALNGSGTLDTVAGGTPTLIVGNGNANGSFSGTIQNTAGTLSLTKEGTGTQTIASYTYSGPTLVTGGTLTMSSSGSVPTTPGGLSVNGGATLVVNASSGTPLPASNVTVGPNGTLNVASSGSAFGINATGALTLQDNTTIILNYGSLSANPAAAAINAASMTAPGANIVINLSASGLQTGLIPLIKYSGTQLASIANFSVILPPGVTATLQNNSGELDLNVTAAPSRLVWNGLNGATWDTSTANWTNPATGTITTYQEHGSGASVGGDSVTFDDTLYQGGSPWPTNINLTAAFHPFPVTVNSTLPYTIAGAGGLDGSVGSTTGFIYLTKTNSGSLTLLTSNSFTGGFYIGGGSVIITNDSALGDSSSPVTLNNSTLQINGDTADSARSISVPVASTVGVASNMTAEFGTVSGAGDLTKMDIGTLALAGSNTLTGVLTVNQGTLATMGNNILTAVPLIGNDGGSDGVLSIAGGAFLANNDGGQYSSSIIVGPVGGAAGAIRMSSGTLASAAQFGLGAGAGGYAALTMSGGSLSSGSYLVVGFNNDTAIFNQSGGSVNVGANYGNLMTIGAGGSASVAVASLSGGTLTATNGSNAGIRVGENGHGTLNVSGTASVILTGGGLNLGTTGGGANGTVNLDGGMLSANRVLKGAGTGTLNFNGGTLAANADNGSFMSGLSSANVYQGGAIIDDGGNNITISQPLLGVTNGYGVTSIPLSDGGSGYVAPPVVTVIDDNSIGSNATAVAQIDVASGTVTNILITCPGSGFDPAQSIPDLTFSGGGAAPVPPTVNVFGATFVANGPASLTKLGSGTVTLTGVNTFGGRITNNAGTLVLNSASTYAGATVNAGTVRMSTASTFTGATTVSNGATLGVSQVGSNTASVGDLTFNGGTLGVALTAGNVPSTAFINCGTLTLNGTNSISLAGAVEVGTIQLIKAVGAIAGTGNITNLTLPQGVVGSISTSTSGGYTTVSAVITSTGPGLVWTGTNSAPGLANVWDINSTVNWLLGTKPTTYQQTIVPGDAVAFNDMGSGTVLLSNSVGPASLVISNNAVAYTFSGSGNITGPTGLEKLGPGTATINLSGNNYVGDTTVSGGTLQLGSAAALPSTGTVNVGSGGTVELAGISATLGELTGSGIVDNNSGTAPILTLGTSAGGIWNGTIQDQGAGGVALHKVGSGTWIVGGTNYLNNNGAFTVQNQITAGTVIITNGGLVQIPNIQLQIANGAGASAAVVVDGGTLAVTNNVLSVGYGDNTAVGTLTVNHGTVLHAGDQFGGAFAAVANSIDVGAQGASGTLTVNGGQVLNGQILYLGDGTGANGTLNLNGGLLQAADIEANGTPNSDTAYFNGGTLQAVTNSTSFLQVLCYVKAGGLILDDNGWTLSIGGAALQDYGGQGGGLFKEGSGTVYLDVPNTYTGLTVVTNGMLAGIGQVAGSVLVTSGGTIGAGDAGVVGTFTVVNGGNLTLQGTTSLRISKTGGTLTSDEIVVSSPGTIAYGGKLIINNITSDGTALQVGDTFQIFNAGGTGDFTSVTGPGATYSFDHTTGILTVTSVTPGPVVFTNPTGITSFKLNGSNVEITGTNGQAGATYYLLQSTNVSLPLSQWVPVATNVVGANGDYSFTGTNAVTPGGVQQFYILSNTNN